MRNYNLRSHRKIVKTLMNRGDAVYYTVKLLYTWAGKPPTDMLMKLYRTYEPQSVRSVVSHYKLGHYDDLLRGVEWQMQVYVSTPMTFTF